MREQLRCELVSWGGVQRLCQRLSAQIAASGFRPDLVVAIARGGFVPARLVCDALGIMALTSIKIEHYLSGSEKQPRAVILFPLCVDIRGKKVLLVDDVNDTGDTLKLAMEHLWSFQPAELRSAVMHEKCVTHYRVDYFARQIIKWRWLVYPWALHEDIGAFLQRLCPVPSTLPEAQRLLKEQFAISLGEQTLREVSCAQGDIFPWC